jgi:hypothetical protein
MSVSGVAPVGVPGIENIDLSGVVTQVRTRLAVSHGRHLPPAIICNLVPALFALYSTRTTARK